MAVSALAEPGSTVIKLVALYNLGGEQQSLDLPSANGARQAVGEINLKGGVLNRRIELQLLDGRSNPKTIATLAKQVAADPEANFVFGFSDTDMVEAAAGVITEAGKLFITSGATSPKLPDQFGTNFFLACYGDNTQAAAAADFLKLRGVAKIGVITEQDMEFTRLLSGYFRNAFAARGGAVDWMSEAWREKGGLAVKDLAEDAAKSRNGTEAVYLAAGPDSAGGIVARMRLAGIDRPIIGGDGCDTPLLPKQAGEAANNVFFTTHVLLSNEPKPGSLEAQFIDGYVKRYGRNPENAFAALGYDTVYLIADAIKRAGSADAALVRDALEQTQAFTGVTGQLRYPKGVRVPVKSVTVVEIKNGKSIEAAVLVPEQVPDSADVKEMGRSEDWKPQ